MPKDITDIERSNSAGKSDSAGNRAGPRRANISWIKETKHHNNKKTNRTKLLETKTGLRVNKVHGSKLQSSTTKRAWAPDAANSRPSKGESQGAANPGDNTAVRLVPSKGESQGAANPGDNTAVRNKLFRVYCGILAVHNYIGVSKNCSYLL